MGKNKNKAKKRYFEQYVYPEIQKELLNTYLDCECLSSLYGHYRVMNDLGEYFDFWTTGTLMKKNGQYLKEVEADVIKEQMRLLKQSSERADGII